MHQMLQEAHWAQLDEIFRILKKLSNFKQYFSTNSLWKKNHYFKSKRASEQPDENQLLQQMQNDNPMYDNSQADICNEEEYNKIFRPNNEIKRRKIKF